MNKIDFKLKINLPNFTLRSESNFSQGLNYIWGRSGQGKSTLFNSISGFIKNCEGFINVNDEIIFSSENKKSLPPEKRKISYVQQNDLLFSNLTVYENLKFGYQFLNEKDKKITPNECASYFNVEELLNLYPNELSGGQKQRVSLARAFSRNAGVVLLDEPINSLDAFSRKDILGKIEKITNELNLCLLFVTHYIEDIFEISNDILLVENGTANKKINKKDIFNHWEEEDVLNQIVDNAEFEGKFFNSNSVMISKKKFDHTNHGFYFSGIIDQIINNKNNSLLNIDCKKNYFISIDNKILNSLDLSKGSQVECFVYKNLII